MARRFAEPKAPTPATAAQVIEALEAACLIVKTGWVQRAGVAIVDGVPCYCTVAAITRAARTKQIRDAAVHAAQLALPARFASRTVEAFNDDKSTGIADVTWLLVVAKNFASKAVAA